MACEIPLNENSSDALGLLWVQSLSTFEFFSVFEDDNSRELGELKVVLGRRELVNVDLVGNSVMSVAPGSTVIQVNIIDLKT